MVLKSLRALPPVVWRERKREGGERERERERVNKKLMNKLVWQVIVQ